jgi:hypothetical protein
VTWSWCRRPLAVAAVALLTACTPAASAQTRFVGDFETGNFDQWPNCQSVDLVTGACKQVGSASPSMRVQSDVVRQGDYAARFEVRPGDQPKGICCGDRAEVSGEDRTAANEGDDRWYQWSTMFGEGFPADQGWGVISQWHADAGGSPPLAFSTGPVNVDAGRWGIVLTTWEAPGVQGPVYTPWSAPVVRGVWNDVRIHVKWSGRSDTGFVEFWLNGVPQKFVAAPCTGQTRCVVKTLVPGRGVYFKQGYYRDPDITTTGVIYHDGFSMADTEAGLAAL